MSFSCLVIVVWLTFWDILLSLWQEVHTEKGHFTVKNVVISLIDFGAAFEFF